jgi:hypothetical protein
LIASIARLPMITSRKLVALVDPVTNEYQIDWERSALVSGMLPAIFTLSEDDRTYDLTGNTDALMEILQVLKANGVPMNSMIDLRSNPAARQQVQNIVRRAGTQQNPPPPPVPSATGFGPATGASPSTFMPSTAEPSTAQRLQELETLRATGAVSEQEYTTKRQQILSDL